MRSGIEHGEFRACQVIEPALLGAPLDELALRARVGHGRDARGGEAGRREQAQAAPAAAQLQDRLPVRKARALAAQLCMSPVQGLGFYESWNSGLLGIRCVWQNGTSCLSSHKQACMHRMLLYTYQMSVS